SRLLLEQQFLQQQRASSGHDLGPRRDLSAGRHILGGALGVDYRVRGLVAEGGVHHHRPAVRGGQPGDQGDVQLWRELDAGTQITSGAPADVFASASQKNMMQVVTAGDATGSTNFVKNVMEIAVPPSNPGHVAGVADLAKSSVKVALC